MKESVQELVERRLTELGITRKSASEHVGKNHSYIQQFLERSVPKKLPEQVRYRLAELLKVDEADLRTPDQRYAQVRASGNFTNVSTISSIPLVGDVQAGVWLEVDGFHGDEEEPPRVPIVPNPKYAGFKQWAVRVIGDSVNKRIDDGAFAHCVDVECGRQPKDGDLVVVERLRDSGGLVETTIKEVRDADNGLELWPCSTNPAHNGPIQLGNGEESTSVAIKGFVIGAYRDFE